MTLMNYATLVFDCDGVVLDSNKVKTEAFRQAAMPYGCEAADALAAHHVANGGISRYRKFEYFLSDIVPKGEPGPSLDELLGRFARAVSEGLEACEITPGFESPTISSLHDPAWVAVRAMVPRRDVHRVMDELYDLGARGILVTAIHASRL